MLSYIVYIYLLNIHPVNQTYTLTPNFLNNLPFFFFKSSFIKFSSYKSVILFHSFFVAIRPSDSKNTETQSAVINNKRTITK